MIQLSVELAILHFFREYKDKVLEKAYEALAKCDCERSCTKCLIDRRSQWYINYLNRQKALKWLEMERNSRVAPKSIVSEIHDASAVTTDFSTEFYQLTRNDNVKSLKVFVDNDYDNWQLDDFPYSKLLGELSLSGVDVAYVWNKSIRISSCSASSKAILMAALFKNKFEYVKVGLRDSLKPLLAVTFSDGTKKMYFGENVDTSLTAKWGDGDVFSSLSNILMEYVPINPSDVLSEMNADDGSIMFDARILEDCNVGNFMCKVDEMQIREVGANNFWYEWEKCQLDLFRPLLGHSIGLHSFGAFHCGCSAKTECEYCIIEYHCKKAKWRFLWQSWCSFGKRIRRQYGKK